VVDVDMLELLLDVFVVLDAVWAREKHTFKILEIKSEKKELTLALDCAD
jgi:hypothetical protein